MDENIITWNATNWITITLMAFIGFIVVGFVAQLARRGFGKA
jgi:uncharacterized membrane protein SirB2